MSLINELKRRNVLRVGAAYVVGSWLLIQVAETIFPLFGFGDTPARIVVTVLAIGFIPAMIFAWVFEFTPEGLKKETEIDRNQPVNAQLSKKLDRMIMLVLALALGYFAFDKFVLDPQRESSTAQQQARELQQVADKAREQGRTEAVLESYGDKSIAVMAFEDMSINQDQEYLSDGIAEELLNILAKVSDLRVISRSSAFSYKGKDLKLTDIAKELNVVHILEGSVRKAGNQVRVTAQLIDARSDTHLWSETYDRELTDIFGVQDDIAATVAERLESTLLGSVPKLREVDPGAYELLLEARHVRRSGEAEAWQQSNELADRALAIEPDFARPWIVKAGNFSNMASSGVLPRDEAYELARAAGDKALAINPDRAGGHSALGWVAMEYDNDLVLAARNFERSLELEPSNLSVLSNSAVLLMKLRRHDSAVKVQEYISPRNPLSAIAFFNLGQTYFAANQFSDAVDAFQSAMELSPNFRGGNLWLGKAQLLNGDAAGSCESMRKEEFVPFQKLGLAFCTFALGQHDEADAMVNWIMEHGEQHFPYDIASVWAYRGDGEQISHWIRKSIEYNDTDIGDPVMDPFFVKIQDDPGWINLMKAIGKSPAQLDSIEFEVALPAG